MQSALKGPDRIMAKKAMICLATAPGRGLSGREETGGGAARTARRPVALLRGAKGMYGAEGFTDEVGISKAPFTMTLNMQTQALKSQSLTLNP